VLRRLAPSWLLELPALFDAQERDALQRQGLGLTRERRLRELAEALEALTTRREAGNEPPLFVLALEDLQWADPSTIELLTMLARRPDRARLLVLGSYRSVDATAPNHPLRRMLRELRAHSEITEIALHPLAEAHVGQYLDARFPTNDFSTRIAPVVHQRTAGNPLFLADVVRELLARRLVVPADGGWAFRGDAETIRSVMPASLRHLIEKQRDELSSEEKRLLQAASVVGLEFSAAAVAAALAEPPAEVEECALRLAGRECLRVVGSERWPDGTRATRFSFLHTLYRDLWNEQIPESRLAGWHQRIAERRAAAYGDRAQEIAAELAAHFEQARDFGRAAFYLAQASGLAWQRAAENEARAHLSRALGLLLELPETNERLAQELQLQLRLAQLIAYTEGYDSASSERAYRRAHEICAEVGDSAAHFESVGGLFRIAAFRGEAQLARDLARQFLRIAEETKDPIRVGNAHLSLGQMLLFQGEPVDALRHLKRALELCRANWNDALLPAYGLHFEVIILGTMAAILQVLGHPDQASRFLGELESFLRGDAHPLTETGALWGVAMLRQMRGDAAPVTELAEIMLRRCATYGPKDWIPLGEAWLSWGLAAQGKFDDSANRRRGMEVSGVFRTYALAIAADGHRRLGQVAEARAVLGQAFAAARSFGPGWYDAELHRLDGELRLEPVEAEACFRRALELARSQHAKSWELRAALSLGELWRRQGKEGDARAIVAGSYDGFTEGFDTPDLKSARAFLSSPSHRDEALPSG
jgi:tetratricopeptide (TPR) repeat protein